jgi:hypothetical protein
VSEAIDSHRCSEAAIFYNALSVSQSHGKLARAIVNMIIIVDAIRRASNGLLHGGEAVTQ